MSTSTQPAARRAATRSRASLMRSMAGYAPARRLARRIFPWLSSEYLISSGLVRIPENHPSTEAQLLADRPFVAGTGILGGLVTPIASPRLRDVCGHATISEYLIESDTWSMLVSRFLKERSKILELGCGCGELARTLVSHPHVARYIGVESSAPGIEWCDSAILPRVADRFEFHLVADHETTESLPAPEGAIDLVLSRSMLGRLAIDDVKHYLSEARRTLASNGLFLAAVPRVDETASPRDRSSGSTAVDPDQFQQLAEDAGLQVYQRMGLLGNQELFIFTKTTNPAARKDGDRALTDEMLRVNQLTAELQGVDAGVHADDFIYWFCATHPLLSLEGGIHYYFRDGGTSAGKLVDLIAGFEDLDLNSVKLLEFASGYGCVTRHLKKRPNLELISCDIHPQALEFLSRTLGVRTLTSAHRPEEFAPPEKYDVIFALSFFSHMPKRTFGPWLKCLFQALHDPGYLVFTTLGLKACKDCGIEPSDIPEDGLWFEARSEQHDLDEAEYGMTIVTPEFVRSEVERQTGAQVVVYKQVGWWDNQDLWVIKRDN